MASIWRGPSCLRSPLSPLFIVLLKVYLKDIEFWVEVNNVVVFDSEFYALFRFIYLVICWSYDALDDVNTLNRFLKVQSPMLPCRKDDIERVD